MARSARGLCCFGGLVHTGFEVQRGFGVLLEELVVAGLAVTLFRFDVGSVIERHVSRLGGERQFCWRFCRLSRQKDGGA